MSLPPINTDSIRNYDRSTQIFFRRSSLARFHTLNEDSWGQLHLTLLSEYICLCTRVVTFNVYVYMFIYFSVHLLSLVQCGGWLFSHTLHRTGFIIFSQNACTLTTSLANNPVGCGWFPACLSILILSSVEVQFPPLHTLQLGSAFNRCMDQALWYGRAVSTVWQLVVVMTMMMMLRSNCLNSSEEINTSKKGSR